MWLRLHPLFSSSFFYLPLVESLPNEVADGSILLRDRVERLPTLKSINLTVSISTQTSLSTLFKTKKKTHLYAPACCYPACPFFFELTNAIYDSTFMVGAGTFELGLLMISLHSVSTMYEIIQILFFWTRPFQQGRVQEQRALKIFKEL